MYIIIIFDKDVNNVEINERVIILNKHTMSTDIKKM